MTRALVIPVVGRPFPTEIDGLRDLQNIVGGFIERIPWTDHSVIAYADEEAKAKRRPVNKVATKLANINVHDRVVGTVVLLGAPDTDGNETDVPARVVAKLRGNLMPPSGRDYDGAPKGGTAVTHGEV